MTILRGSTFIAVVLPMAIGYLKPTNLFGNTKYLNMNLVSYDPEFLNLPKMSDFR
jgi:hypothetical protein